MIFPAELSLPSAWISLGIFLACISCVIISPRAPLFPRKRFFQKLLSMMCEKKNPKQIDIELMPLNTPIVQPVAPTITSEPYFYWVTLDMATAPLISLILLFVLQCLNLDTFVAGIAGDDKIRPYGVIILFMSLSYVCISLDITGLFAYIASILIIKSAGRGHALFMFFGLFASVLTLFTSNDIVILTLTPICCYLAKNAENLDIIPFVISQFFLANVWSVAFQIGNPTNMIVAEAYKMNFLKYLLYMGLPALAAGVISFAVLYRMFFDRIPKLIIINSQHQDPTPSLANKRDATIKFIGLLVILVLLMITSLMPMSDGSTIPPYLICLASAVLFLIYDLISDVGLAPSNYWDLSFNMFCQERAACQIFFRMPWKIIPFVFGMFVMVELLNRYGFVTLMASILADIISSPTSSGSFSSILTACFVMSILSTFACNVLNNQPMTILFTKILLSPAFVQDSTLQKASSFSLILGSNLGANVTLIGALAGVMWSQILQDSGVGPREMNYWKFLKYGLCVTPLALAGATFVIATEMLVTASF